ncbi:phage tail protein, partial [Serratia marcescens]|nr:phage tail protein [Serratia marcescens]
FNLLNDLRNPKIAKILEGSGVNLRDKRGNMLPINDIVKDIAQRSGKDGSKRQDERLAKTGFTDYSRLIISSVTTGKGAENFARYNAVVADGSSIMADAKYASQDFTSAMQSLNTT